MQNANCNGESFIVSDRRIGYCLIPKEKHARYDEILECMELLLEEELTPAQIADRLERTEEYIMGVFEDIVPITHNEEAKKVIDTKICELRAREK